MGQVGSWLYHRGLPGALLFSKKVKTCHQSCPYTLSYGHLYYRGGDDYYLMWGGHPFPFHWECAECRQRAECKVQRGKQRAQECIALPIFSGSAGPPGVG